MTSASILYTTQIIKKLTLLKLISTLVTLLVAENEGGLLGNLRVSLLPKVCRRMLSEIVKKRIFKLKIDRLRKDDAKYKTTWKWRGPAKTSFRFQNHDIFQRNDCKKNKTNNYIHSWNSLYLKHDNEDSGIPYAKCLSRQQYEVPLLCLFLILIVQQIEQDEQSFQANFQKIKMYQLFLQLRSFMFPWHIKTIFENTDELTSNSHKQNQIFE